MNKQNALRVALSGTMAVAALLANAGTAHAVQYGQIGISTDTTMTTDRFGSIVFAADNITLDCNHHQIHISASTPINCSPFYTSGKCGIVAAGRTGITIKNCNVVGAYTVGVDLEGTQDSAVFDTNASGNNVAFNFSHTTHLVVERINANLVGTGVLVGYDTESYFQAVTTNATTSNGVSVFDSSGTWLDDVTVSNAGDFGFISNYNTYLMMHRMNVNHSIEGFVDFDSEGLTLDAGVFEWNNLFGLVVRYDRYNTITDNLVQHNNQAHSPYDCDAFEEEATSNFWSGNQLETRCGSVPASH